MISTVCADGFVTADITRHNLTHINVTCVIHIGIPYCCLLYKQPGSSQIKQGLMKAPTNLTSYYCVCSFTCNESFKSITITSGMGSNSTKFDPTNFSKCACMCVCVRVCV